MTSSPAAYDTIRTHFRDTGRSPSDYDLIITGDLGRLGRDLVKELFRNDGISLPVYSDCGAMIFDCSRQDVHCGGSGAGCCASVLAGYLLNGMREGHWQRILFCPTGALLSPVSCQQGETIPAICHAIAFENQS